MNEKIENLKIKLYADGAIQKDLDEIIKTYPISGVTTNPSLMAKAGVKNYLEYAKELLSRYPRIPFSFEVFADDLLEMYEQALILKELGPRVFVKIPVMNTKEEKTKDLIAKLTKEGMKLNVTAIFTQEQVEEVSAALEGTQGAIVSIFAGRIADTGSDPIPLMKKSVELLKNQENVDLLWASTREVFNIFEADRIGVDIITVPPSILKKLSGVGKDHFEYSKDTVIGFYKDSTSAGFRL